ncbi:MULTISPECIES: hypothetical protein [unclassified Shewanella]|uniref:hypothetical protein n=1 Tax=unclassified Shewanella TaxID=196818 RepID=UPI0039B55F60
MIKVTPLEAKEIYEALSPTWSEASSCLGAAVVLNDSNLELIKRAADCELVAEFAGVVGARVKRSKEIKQLSSDNYGETLNISFNVDSGSIRFFKSFDELIASHPTERPDGFVVTSEVEGVIYYPCENPSGRLMHYLEVHRLWAALLEKSDDVTANGLTFLYKGKLYLRGVYSSSCLENGFDGLTKFLSVLQKDEHHEVEKGHILQNTLYSFLYHVKEEDKFTYLLNNFSSFSLKFDEAYQAYSVGFSFDKLRAEHEERYRDYMVKVNDLVTSSLTKSLAIPATIFITSTRTQAIATAKSGETVSEIMAVNIGVGLVALIVSLVFSLAMIYELKSIESIRLEYESLMGRLEKKSEDAYKAISDFRTSMASKLSYARLVLLSLVIFSFVHAAVSLLWVASRTQGWSFFLPVTEVAALTGEAVKACLAWVLNFF